MEEGKGKITVLKKTEKDELRSKVIRAGKRTYFFDVKSTQREECYLTITESKKRFNQDGSYFYEKHKIFLYNEDFEPFTEGLSQMMAYIRSVQTSTPSRDNHQNNDYQVEITEKVPPDELEEAVAESFTNVEFDELGKKN
jgi:hypothetical protein